MTMLVFVVAMLVIVAAAELFTNAIEWAGFRLRLGGGATGSLLAALGTALPEATVPIVALVAGAPSATQVATGVVLGSSFLLLTMGTALTGLALVMRRRAPELAIAPAQARRDLGSFASAFALLILAMALPRPAHYVIGVLLLAIYVAYVTITLRGGEPTEEMPDPLHLLRRHSGHDPHNAGVVLQLAIAIGGLVLGSKLFVTGLDQTASALNISTLVLALVLVPLATELPETLNGVLWVRSNDDGLAFGNIAGAATFQACILGFIGVTFTPWQPGGGGLLSSVLTWFTAVVLLWLLRHGRTRGRWLALAALPWLAYVAVVLTTGGHIGASPG